MENPAEESYVARSYYYAISLALARHIENGFGTNWLKHGIRVRQGQIILARLVSDPAQVYALEIAKQKMTNAVVYYLKKPL